MELSAIPLAFLAGLLSLLSPCVLPMLPAVATSAMRSSPLGLWLMALGLSLAFASAGSFLTYLFLNMDISPDILRTVAAIFLLIMSIALLVKPLADKISAGLSRLTSYLPLPELGGTHTITQFFIGLTLGLVWLPCVGPTLGSAIALASLGQDMGMAFTVMLFFGLGTALPLVMFGYTAGKWLEKLNLGKPLARKLMGGALLLLSLSILTGADKHLEIWAMQIMPDWAIDI